MTRHESILLTFGLVLVTGVLAWTFWFDLNFRSKILANLTANWKTCGPTKPDNYIINAISHHGNWVILSSVMASPLPPFLNTYSLPMSSLRCKAFCIIIMFSCSLVHLLKFFLPSLQEWSRVAYEKDSPGIYSFDGIYCLVVWFRIVFSFSWSILFSFSFFL